MKKIFPWYIRAMDYFLLAMSDDDLDEFNINNAECQAKLFDAMKADFDRFGPVSKQRTLESLEYLYSSGQIEKLWGYVVPGAADVEEVEDKHDFLRALYRKLSGHKLEQKDFGADVELVTDPGPRGVDIRE